MRKKNPYALTRKTLRSFWQHAAKYRLQLIVLVVGVFALEAFNTYVPTLYRDLIDSVSGSGASALPVAVRIVILILIFNFLRVAIWRAIIFVNNYFQPKVMSDLTNTAYQHLMRHSYGFFTSKFSGSLVTKVKRYERAFETISDQILFDLGRSTLIVGLILGVFFWRYPLFGWITLVWILLYVGISYAFSVYKLRFDLRRAEADSNTTAQLADSITNNTNIKIFTNYEKEDHRFAEVTREQFLARKKAYDLGNFSEIAQGLLSAALEFILIYLAVKQWARGAFSAGDIVLIQLYLMRMLDKLWSTGRNIRSIYESLADANEMTEMLVEPHQVADAPDAKKLRVAKGAVELKDVFFGYYEDLQTLKKFNLSIAPGERVAFVGPSGGGKSTIIKLLFRFHDITSGEITIDGQNIAQVTQDSLRQALSLVPQDPILFHRSLMENIRYARPKASDKDVLRAAKLAHAHEFISKFPDGYDTLVGERGIKLSGGERQRVAIARAILKDAPILVLDEATSSLDSESEMLIQDALSTLMTDRTTIVVAHRLSTIMQMDRIIVIDSGKIIEEGKHQELLKVKQGVYQKLWNIQAGGFAKA